MNLTCPHCSAVLEPGAETHADPQDSGELVCPACGGRVPVPDPAARLAVAPPIESSSVADSPVEPRAGSAGGTGRLVWRRLNRKLLVVGGAALLVLGGVVVFLTTRPPAVTRQIDEKTVTQRVFNDYFTRLIQDGMAAEKDLGAISLIEAFGACHIGLTAEALAWQDAEALARRAGGGILELPPPGPHRDELLGWLATAHPSALGKTTWVLEDGKPAVIDTPDSGPVSNPGRPRRAFVFWPGDLITGWGWSIEPRFDEVMPFDADEFATVRIGDEWRRIDKRGADAGVPPAASLHAFNPGGFAGIRNGDQVGVIDREGKVWAKAEWDDVQEPNNGFTPVKRDGKWGYLDAGGNQVVPCAWDDAWRFSPQGYAVVTRDGKRGIIDRGGKLIVQPEWDGVINFCKEGIGAVRSAGTNLWGLVDTTGKLLHEPRYEIQWGERRFDLGFIRARLPGQVEYEYLGTDGKLVDRATAESRMKATPRPRLPWIDPAGPIPFRIIRPTPSLSMRPGLGLIETAGLGGYFNRHGESDSTRLLVNALGHMVMPDPAPRADFRSDFIPYATPPKFGLMKADGTVLVSPRWDEVRILSRNWIRFRVGRKFGLADGTGKVVVEPRWDAVEVLAVDSGSLADDGKRILLGRDGKLILSPWIRAKDGLTTVILRNNGQPALSDALAGSEYVDFYGPDQVVITEPAPGGLRSWSLYEPATGRKTTFPSAVTMRWNWSTALAGLIWVKDRTAVWHLMDRIGRDLGHTKDEEPLGWEIRDGCGLLHDADGPFFINAKGRRIGTGGWEDAREFTEGRAAIQQDGKWGFIDTEGRIVCAPKWDAAFDFQQGVAAVRDAGLYGFIDADGKTLAAPKWDTIRGFHHGLAAVWAGGFWGYIDRTGKVAVQPVWDRVQDFQVLAKPVPPGETPAGPVIALVTILGKWACIDTTGRLLADPKYDWIRAEGELLVAGTRDGARDVIRISAAGEPLVTAGKPQAGRYYETFDVAADRSWQLRPKGAARNSSDWALCDETGRPLTPFRWARPWRDHKLHSLSRGAILARSQFQGYGLLRYDGTELLPAKFEHISWTAPGAALVWSATEGGLFDTAGKWRCKDNDKVRIARFDPRAVPRPLEDGLHDLIVTEDTPKWGYAKLVSEPRSAPQR